MNKKRMQWMFALAMGLAMVGYPGEAAWAQRDGDSPRRDRQRDGGQRDGGKRDEQRKKMHKMLFKDIDLTQEQKDQVKAIHQETRAAHEQWRAEHQDEIDAIRAEMKQARENKDRDAMKAAHEKMRELRKDAPGPQQALDRIADEVLTDDQQAQFEENRKKFRETMKDRHQKKKGSRKRGRGGDDDRRRNDDN